LIIWEYKSEGKHGWSLKKGRGDTKVLSKKNGPMEGRNAENRDDLEPSLLG